MTIYSDRLCEFFFNHEDELKHFSKVTGMTKIECVETILTLGLLDLRTVCEVLHADSDENVYGVSE